MQTADCRPGIKYILRVKRRLQIADQRIKYRLRVKCRLQTAEQRIKY